MSTLTTNPSEVKFTPYVPAKDEEYMSDAQLEHFKAILFCSKDEGLIILPTSIWSSSLYSVVLCLKRSLLKNDITKN